MPCSLSSRLLLFAALRCYPSHGIDEWMNTSGDVIFLNKMIASAIEKGASTAKIYENWDVLQSQIGTMHAAHHYGIIC
jgi:hypothetical protein